jgi:DsbC/DsbD-like thiol-disulfide interchange protein
MIVLVPLRAVLGVAALYAACATSEVRAEDASPWQRDAHSAVRLLAGSRSGTVLLGGVAIQLEPGWKTYWRTPGDSGVPPRFDFSKSDNVEAVTVLWPAPKKFDDGAGGTALGYKQQVVLPLRIVAKNADKPVTLRAHVSYAVCDKLCIPVEAQAELAFASVASTEDGNLSDALNTVVSLFVEGPTPDWALPVPKLVEQSPPGVKRFTFELDGLPPGASAEGAALKLTLVGGDRAYEFNVSLN